jgi:flavin-dependent dehydrogenase
MSDGGRVDVLVVGAGPAGCAAAVSAAAAGAEVMLVDRGVFPRNKVCGGCIAPAGVAALGELGLGGVLEGAGAPVRELELRVRARRVVVPLGAAGVCVGREVFDHALVRAAAGRGVRVIEGAVARLVRNGEDGAESVLVRDGREERVLARAVVVADGLGGTFLRDAGWAASGAPGSRVGLGARVEAGLAVAGGRVVMHVAPGGYVGMVRLRDGTIDVGAALSPELVRRAGGPGAAVRMVVRDASGSDAPWACGVAWRGTAALTRRRGVARGVVACAGDAAGYVEPFTGEGISWALRCGMLAGRHAARVAGGQGTAGGWERIWARECRGSHRRCKAAAWCARCVPLVAAGVAGASVLPVLGGAVRACFGGAWERAGAGVP